MCSVIIAAVHGGVDVFCDSLGFGTGGFYCCNSIATKYDYNIKGTVSRDR